MITFLDSQQIERSAQVGFSTVQSVNGELSVKGTIYTNDDVLKNIDRGWRFRLNDEYYRIIYVKPIDTGKQLEVEFDAVHQFFYDMAKSSMYEVLDGTYSLRYYLEAIFKNSGYKFDLDVDVKSIRKSDFGCKSRLSLFNDIIKTAGVEFLVSGHLVRIRKSIGSDQSTLVRKNFNMNEITIEKDINSFVTYQKGFGAWKDETDRTKGRYESEYESSLAKIYGRIEAEPVVDERYKETGKLLERLKQNVDNSYKISIAIDMEDLSAAGYKTSTPEIGDYIMAINETLGIRKRVRIVSLENNYDVSGKLIKRKVVCNDIGSVQRYSSEMSVLSRSVSDSKNESSKAIETAIKALVSAEGKNTNYFGDVKPLDVPKGTLRKGDRLFLTVGDETELYFWSGSEWVIEPTRFDKEKFNVEFDKKAETINKSIQQAESEATSALAEAGLNNLLAQEAKQISERARADIVVLRQNISNDYVAKSQHVEDVRGLTRRFEEINLGSPNLVINGAAELGGKNWGGTNEKWFTNRTHDFYKNSSAPLFTLDTKEAGLCYIQTGRYNQLKKNTDYTLSFTGFMSRNVSGFRVLVGLLSNKDNVWKKTLDVFNQRLSPKQAERFTVQFNSGDYDGFSLRFDNFGSTDGQSATVWITEIDVYEGTMKRAYQPAPENNQNYADAKISEYRTAVDGRFASITSQIAGKANLLDFQRVQETSKLYERIIGRSESDIADKIARMALTNQLFQVEVGKYGSDGINRALNTSNGWTNFITIASPAGINLNADLHKIVASGLVAGDKLHVCLEISIDDVQPITGKTATAVLQSWGDVKKWNSGNPFSYRLGNLIAGNNWRKIEYDVTLTGQMLGNNFWWLNVRVDGASRYKVHTKLLKIEKGSRATPWSPAPEDTDEAIRTVQSQLAGSWAVQNINSAGDLISGLNLGANGHNRLSGKLTHITGETLIDNAVIKSAMIESVLADKITTGTLNAANVNIINLNANKIVGLDATFLRGKIENAIIDWLVGKTLISQNGSTTLNLQTGVFTLNNEDSSITFSRSSDNTATTFSKNGIRFLKNGKNIASIGQSAFSSIYDNKFKSGFSITLPTNQGVSFSGNNSSSFFEINPYEESLSIQSGFSLLIGIRTSQSVSLEHVFGTTNNVNFSGFRAKGTRRQELRFYADGRIEITTRG